MEIAFSSRHLRSICETADAADNEYGAEFANSLRDRLADLDAATKIDDLLVGELRDFSYDELRCKALTIVGQHILVFCSNHTSEPKTLTGSIDWSNVRRIKIVMIGVGE